MFTFKTVPFVLAGAALATSCTLGRDYKRPAIETPSTYRHAASQASAASLADVQWFDLFRDDTLTQLVRNGARAELRNPNRGAACAAGSRRIWHHQVRSVSISRRVRRSHGRAIVSNRRQPAASRQASTPTSATRKRASASGGKLDVWGRLRRLSEAARAQYLASEEARHGVITTLIADVSDTYLRCARSTSSWRSRIGPAMSRTTASSSPRRGARAAWRTASTSARPSSCCSRRPDKSPASSGRSRRRRTRSACCLATHLETFRAAVRSRRSQAPPSVPAGSAIGAARAAARHPAGRAGTDRRKRADRRRQGRVLPAHQPHWVPWRTEPRADRSAQRSGPAGDRQRRRRGAGIQRRTHTQRT